MPEEAKPNRRRAIIVCTVFAVVLCGVIYYLWTNHAYLKWRFIGGEVGLMESALKVGQLSPDQVVSLATSGATHRVRICSLRTITESDLFETPYEPRIVEAVRSLADVLPEDELDREVEACIVVRAVSKSGRKELLSVLEAFAANPDTGVRASVTDAFCGETDFGEQGWDILRRLTGDPDAMVRESATLSLLKDRVPEWAAPVLRGLLDDANAGVRRSAAFASGIVLRRGECNDIFSPRLLEIMRSTEEDHRTRARAIWALGFGSLLESKELAELTGSPSERMAKAARKVIEMRAAEREEAREGAPSDE